MPKKPNQIYQIKVSLKNTHPPVWRRILVPDNTTLLKLHDILQIAMGWKDYHLHIFTIDGMFYGDPTDFDFDDLETFDEARFKLKQVITRKGQRLSYQYDFGDNWDHSLLVEKILPPEKGVRYPICLKGKRACPPEDVGGVWGYHSFLEAIRNPDHDEHEEYLAWIGGEFDPEAFDLAEVNARLGGMGKGISTEVMSPWFIPDDDLDAKGYKPASPLIQTQLKGQEQVAEVLPLRRDVVALLTYLRDNKVVGTQSTGNFPLKAVREICARFVDPPPMENAIGEKIYRVRSEDEVWPLLFRHTLALTSGLIAGGLSQRWTLTSLGESFLAAPATTQVWVLLASWWIQTNWAIASPIVFNSGSMGPEIPMFALKRLLEIPSGEIASFERFADQLIADSRMVWPIEDQDTARSILRNIIESTVVDPLVDFEILQTEYRPHTTLGANYRELSTIQITPFGKILLKAMDDFIN
jgi:hypothetical protein